MGAVVCGCVLAMSYAMSRLGIFVILSSDFMPGFALYLQTRCTRYNKRGAAGFCTLSSLNFRLGVDVSTLAIVIKCFNG